MIAKAATAAKPLLLAPATTSTSVAVDQAAPGCFRGNSRRDRYAQRRATAKAPMLPFISDDDDEGSYDDGTYERVTRTPGYRDEGSF